MKYYFGLFILFIVISCSNYSYGQVEDGSSEIAVSYLPPLKFLGSYKQKYFISLAYVNSAKKENWFNSYNMNFEINFSDSPYRPYSFTITPNFNKTRYFYWEKIIFDLGFGAGLFYFYRQLYHNNFQIFGLNVHPKFELGYSFKNFRLFIGPSLNVGFGIGKSLKLEGTYSTSGRFYIHPQLMPYIKIQFK